MNGFQVFLCLLRALVVSQARVAAENLALRQQLAIYQQRIKRPRLRTRDGIFWVWLSRLWPDWRHDLVIMRPETVVRWHRQGFRLYWRWKPRNRNA